jgi:hypothetical protein
MFEELRNDSKHSEHATVPQRKQCVRCRGLFRREPLSDIISVCRRLEHVLIAEATFAYRVCLKSVHHEPVGRSDGTAQKQMQKCTIIDPLRSNGNKAGFLI